jgi:hypothetical protein
MTRLVLRNGTTVDVGAWQIALELEAKGVSFRFDDDGRLLATPSDLLTPDDVAAIYAVRHDIARLVRYVADKEYLQ